MHAALLPSGKVGYFSGSEHDEAPMDPAGVDRSHSRTTPYSAAAAALAAPLKRVTGSDRGGADEAAAQAACGVFTALMVACFNDLCYRAGWAGGWLTMSLLPRVAA